MSLVHVVNCCTLVAPQHDMDQPTLLYFLVHMPKILLRPCQDFAAVQKPLEHFRLNEPSFSVRVFEFRIRALFLVLCILRSEALERLVFEST